MFYRIPISQFKYLENIFVIYLLDISITILLHVLRISSTRGNGINDLNDELLLSFFLVYEDVDYRNI